jgi:two-component sensor histidine kinase
MSTPDDSPSETQVERLLGSEELVEAVENDRFRHLLDHVPIGIAISRQVGRRERIIYANAMFENVIAHPLSEFEGMDWSFLDGFRHEDDETQTLGAAVAVGEDFVGTFRRDIADGRHILLQAHVGLVEAHDGLAACRILAVVDVTARERAQRDEFERQIRDKDMLLRELQHRVKNNLQLITALIRLEARTVLPQESGALSRLASRIESLALLYQILSAEKFGPEIDLGSYLSQIGSAVVRTHTLPGVELKMNVIYAPASINVAMPVGLLVNEMMTNAFKYAFAGRDGGAVMLECHHDEDGRFQIVVADDGVGMASHTVWPERGKLGALILQTLRENTEQMSFEIETAPGRGTRMILSFTHRVATKVH